MATLRTQEEKSAILAHCLELERTGGDILAYLWSQDYLTPRATWFNYQREWLGRKPYEFTSGKPGKDRKMAKRITVTDELREAAINAALSGGSPCAVLRAAGCKNPSGVWFNIKKKLEQEHPEIAGKITKAKPGPKKQLQLEAGADYDISVTDAMDNMQDAADEFFGQCEDMGLKVGDVVKVEKVSPYTVTAIDTEYGEFYHDKKFGCIDWRNEDGDEVSLKIEQWKKLAVELRTILEALGVEL